MTRYRINEATFTVDPQLIDESVNIFTGRAPDFENTSFVMTRARPDNDDVHAYADEQFRTFESNFHECQLLKSADTEAAGVQCREIAFKWRGERGPVYQWQLYVPAGDIIVVATFTALQQVTDRHRAAIQAFVQSLTLE